METVADTLQELAEEVGRALQKKRWLLATAESVTGGGISQAITDISGSSEWFDCGYVTYSNSSKTEQLDVPAAQVLFVGDSAMDARCAEAAGVRFAAHRAGYAGQPADLLPQVTGFDHYDTFTPWLLGQLSNVLTSSPENCHA